MLVRRLLAAALLILLGACSALLGIDDPTLASGSQADAATGGTPDAPIGGQPDAQTAAIDAPPIDAPPIDAEPPDAPGPTQTLTINFKGDGEGTVVVPGGRMCPPTCSVVFPQGTTVTLTAKPRSWSAFEIWSDGPCNGTGECRVKLDGDVAVTAGFHEQSGGHNFVFISSKKLDPVGLTREAADEACVKSAEDNHIPGTYVSYLATPTGGATAALTGSRGWVRLDGQPFANDIADLRGMQRILWPVLFDASGAKFTGVGVMTAAKQDGSFSDKSCSTFTDTSGQISGGLAEGGSFAWATFWQLACFDLYPVYCFGVGRNTALSSPPVEGRIIFLSRVDNATTGGVARLDTSCQNDASTFGLPGTYKALVALNGASALSRFAAPDVVWSRPDGVRISPPDIQPFQMTTPLNVINMKAGGSYVTQEPVLSGALDLNSPGTADTTCNGWTNATNSYHGYIGAITFASEWLGSPSSTANCNSLFSANVYCLQAL